MMLRAEYDAYVFDTAPTANARRLLGMSKVYALWVEKMLKSRQEARSLREMLSFTRKKEADPLLEYLRSEEHTSELQSRLHLVCRLLLEKKKRASTFAVAGATITKSGSRASP